MAADLFAAAAVVDMSVDVVGVVVDVADVEAGFLLHRQV